MALKVDIHGSTELVQNGWQILSQSNLLRTVTTLYVEIFGILVIKEIVLILLILAGVKFTVPTVTDVWIDLLVALIGTTIFTLLRRRGL